MIFTFSINSINVKNDDTAQQARNVEFTIQKNISLSSKSTGYASGSTDRTRQVEKSFSMPFGIFLTISERER
jgi:hypothetical protein